MKSQSKQIALDALTENINSDYIIFSYSCLTNDSLKKLSLNLKTNGLNLKHVKTSFLRLIAPTLELKQSLYGVFDKTKDLIANKLVVSEIMSITNYKAYKLNDVIQSDFIFVKGLTTMKPVQSYRLLEELTKVSIQKGFIFFNQDFKFLTKNEIITKKQITILKDLKLSLKKIIPEIKCLKISSTLLSPQFIQALSPHKFLELLEKTSQKYLILSESFIKQTIYKIYS